jgi:hypothetical protein
VVYDRLTARYAFSCPVRDTRVHVRLSSFRLVERLGGSAHPAVFDVRFSCPCGGEHDGLVTHGELDWAPVGAPEAPFWNVMTGRLESSAGELTDQAAGNIKRGRWPWCFFCFTEGRPRPISPSAFRLITPREERVVLAAECAGCGTTSVNLVTHEHLDVPFYSDDEVDVVEHAFPPAVAPVALFEDLVAGRHATGTRRLAA